MATWQFDFFLVPRSGVERRFGTLPVTISEVEFNTIDWWSEGDASDSLEADLSKLLPEGISWNSREKTWGAEDSDRFDISRDNERIGEVYGRIDIRRLSLLFLNQIVDLARRHELLFVTEGRHVLRPSVKELLSAIHRSPSFTFVTDPTRFLQQLSNAD